MGGSIEGRNAVLEALRSDMSITGLLMARGLKSSGAIAEIERRARDRGIRIERVDRRELDRRSDHGAHQGVVAEMGEFGFTPLDDVLRSSDSAERSLVIVLDQVTDPGNFGAIVRVADVVGADAVVVAKRRAAPVSGVAFKSSAGALARVPLVQETNLVRALERLKEARYWVAGADGAADQDAWSSDLRGRVALVMGAEGTGMARLTRETCDFLVRLPVAGHVDSLNVSQAAAVLAFEWVRQNGLP